MHPRDQAAERTAFIARLAEFAALMAVEAARSRAAGREQEAYLLLAEATRIYALQAQLLGVKGIPPLLP